MQAGGQTWAVRHGEGLPKSLHGEFVSGNYFQTLGLSSFEGRLFGDADDTPNAPPATVISYQSWKGEFSSDPGIIGSTIHIETRPIFTVVGIAPIGFYGDRVSDTPPDFLPVADQHRAYLRWTVSILHA